MLSTIPQAPFFPFLLMPSLITLLMLFVIPPHLKVFLHREPEVFLWQPLIKDQKLAIFSQEPFSPFPLKPFVSPPQLLFTFLQTLASTPQIEPIVYPLLISFVHQKLCEPITHELNVFLLQLQQAFLDRDFLIFPLRHFAILQQLFFFSQEPFSLFLP